MIAIIHPLRRGIALGFVAAACLFAGGCFQVEEVAQQPDAAAASAEGEPELSIAMGDEAGPLDLNAGPLDLNVDATVGEVSPADFSGASFGSSSEVPDAPTSAGSPPAAPPSFAPQATLPAGPIPETPAAPSEENDFAPSLAGSPAGGTTFQPIAPAPSFDSEDFPSQNGAPGGALAALPDEEFGAPVEPMDDPETAPAAVASDALATADSPAEVDANQFAPSPQAPAPSALVPATPDATPFQPPVALAPSDPAEVVPADEPSTLASGANDPPAEGLLPSGDEWAAEAGAAEPGAADGGPESERGPDLAAAPGPEAPAADATVEANGPAAIAGESIPGAPVVQAPPAEGLTADDDATADGERPDEAVADAALTPFEEELFAPRFGPGRHLAGSSPGLTAPPTIPAPAPALDSDEVEERTPSVLAQEPASPAAETLAMQIVDPSAPPPASLRPTAQPSAALPPFDPTAGDRLSPPSIVDDDGYTPTPPGEEDAPATPPSLDTPGPAPGPAAPETALPSPGSAAPRELPMPGPVQDDEEEEAVPAPPDTVRPAPREERSPQRASTPSEIADASRHWTDASGTHTLEAAILEYDRGEVRLETPAGERYVVSLSSLSRYDQGYVKGLAEATLGKEPETRTWNDASGSFSLDGAFVETDGDVVRIGREDGKTFRIEKRRLSGYDRGYVDGLADAEAP